MNLEPETVEKLKRDLLAFLWLVLILAAFFFWGYWEGSTRAAKDLKAATAQAEAFRVKADHLEAQAKSFSAQGDASKVQAAKIEPRIQTAHARVVKAEQAVAALPEIPQTVPVLALQEEVSALKAELVETRAQNAVLKLEAAQFEQADKLDRAAFQAERLRSLALEGQLAAQKAQGRRAVFFATVKGTFYGAGLDELLRAALSHR